MDFLLALAQLAVEKDFGLVPLLEGRRSVTRRRTKNVFSNQEKLLKSYKIRFEVRML